MASNAPDLAPEAARDAPVALPSAVSRPPRVGGRRAPGGLLLASLAVAAVFAAPLAHLVWENIQRGTDLIQTLRDEQAFDPLRRTLVLAATVSGVTSVVGTALAWLTIRTDLPLRRLWRAIVPLPLVIPSFVGALALLAAFAPGGLVDEMLSPLGVGSLPRIEGFWGATVVLSLLTYPYVYLPVAARLAALPPSLEESARSLGRSPWGVFRSIVVPQLSGAVWAGGLLVFLYTLSEFGAVQLLHYDTLTRAIYSTRLYQRDVSLALSLVLGLVALAVVIAERRVARRRLATEAVAVGRDVHRTPLGAWKAPAAAFVGLVVGIALVAPVAVLLHWTVRGLAGSAVLRVDRLVEPAITTGVLGLVTGVVAVAVVLPVAYLTTRYRSRAGDGANALVVSGFALPGLVVALALMSLVLAAPIVDRLYQTYTLLALAYIVHFGSQAMRTGQVAVSGVPRRVEDAARALGAGRVRRLITVELPLMRGGLVAGTGLVLLSTMKELPATLVLRPIGVETLATRVWGAATDGFYAEAGFAALVLLALAGALTGLLTARNLDRVK